MDNEVETTSEETAEEYYLRVWRALGKHILRWTDKQTEDWIDRFRACIADENDLIFHDPPNTWMDATIAYELSVQEGINIERSVVRNFWPVMTAFTDVAGDGFIVRARTDFSNEQWNEIRSNMVKLIRDFAQSPA
jgi:hypothetical protein